MPDCPFEVLPSQTAKINRKGLKFFDSMYSNRTGIGLHSSTPKKPNIPATPSLLCSWKKMFSNTLTGPVHRPDKIVVRLLKRSILVPLAVLIVAFSSHSFRLISLQTLLVPLLLLAAKRDSLDISFH
jgi:hypothetical protein